VVRSKPFSVITYAIDPKTGALSKRSGAPLAESFPYITVDKTGSFLLGASYGGHLVSVNAIGKDGTVSDPKQVIPTARNAHSIITDNTNRFVFVPHLGTDQIFQFRFDAKTGRLTANTPPLVQMKAGSGPRHIIMSTDNRFAYLLNELTATVTTLSLDEKTGLLTEVGSASALPADTKLVPAPPAPRRGAMSTTTSGRPTYTSRRTASSSTPPSAPAARSARSGWIGHGQANVSLEHAHRDSAARFAIDPKAAPWSCPARNRKPSRSTPSTRQAAPCRCGRSTRRARARTGSKS